MTANDRTEPVRDKLLFTPGPLTTSAIVKRAMLRDLGSRDAEFIERVASIRERLLKVAGVSRDAGYEAILMQGSGTFSVEAVLTCAVPHDGKWLVVVNGAYGERMVKILQVHGVAHTVLRSPEDCTPSPAEVDNILASDSAITAVAIVHCETTTGIMNPIAEVGEAVRRHRCVYFVDSMSAFGGVELDLAGCGADYLVSSSNKCIEGVPGFSFCVARRAALAETRGWSRTLSLDLYEQWRGLESNGQFRFTPPTHALLAFDQALAELEREGGVAGRSARYRENHQTLVRKMRSLGFRGYLRPEDQGHIITSFRYPADPNFRFDEFYRRLSTLGFVIYPGKVSNADCFRIGNIGRIFAADIERLTSAVRRVLDEMNVNAASSGPRATI